MHFAARSILISFFCFSTFIATVGVAASGSVAPPIQGQIVPQIGHAQPVTQIVYSNSGRLIVTGTGDSRIKMWSTDGRLLTTIDVGQYRRFALSPDDSMLAVSQLGGYIELYSLDGNRLLRLPRMPVFLFEEIAFSPTGEYVVACSASTKVDFCQLFDVDGVLGARIANPTNGQQKSNVSGIGFSPDGAKIYLSAGQAIYAYDRNGAPVTQFKVSSGYLAALAVSPDGQLVATADSRTSRDGSIPSTRLWTSSGQLIAEYPNHASRSLAFSRDGEWLIAGGETNNQVLVVDRSGNKYAEFQVGRSSSESPATVAISPNRDRILTADKTLDPVEIRTWLTNGTHAGNFRQSTSPVMAMDFDSRSGLIATASTDNNIRYWSMDGRLLRQHSARFNAPNLLAIAPNGRSVLSGGTEITLWDDEGDPITVLPIHEKGARAIQFAPNSDYLISGGIDGFVNLIPVGSEQQSKRFKAHDGEDVTAIAVHPDGKRFATGSIWERFRIWDFDGNQLADFKLPEGAKAPFSNLSAISFTPDGMELVVNTMRRNEEIRFYDMKGNLSRKIALPVRNTYHNGGMAISADGRWIAVAVNKQIGLWHLDTLEFKKALNGHSGPVRDMEFSDDGEHLVSADSDGVVRVWNVNTGYGFSMLSEGDEWIIYTDDGYFDASRYGSDLVSMVADWQAYSVDQFAVVFNRPDIIYERAGIASAETIDHFRGYYERRLAALDSNPIKEQQVPTVRIVSSQKSGKFIELELESDVADEKYARLQIHANEVAIYPGQGKEIPGGHETLTEQVELTNGNNKIEVSIVTPSGIESVRTPIYAEFNTPAPSDLYFVGLGVSEYRDTELNLNYADDDVHDMGEFLQGYEGHFDKVHRLELTNEQVTRRSTASIEAFLAQAGVDDTVIFLVSGHGGYEYGAESTYYFLPHEGNPEKLSKSAIPYDQLEGMLAGIKPRRKLLFLDTCQSGEFDATTLRSIQEAASKKGLSVRSRQRLISDVINEPRTYLYERDRYIYNSLARRTGAVVFSSSLANESSLEMSDVENGIFTRAIIETLSSSASDTDRDGSLSVDELETGVKLFVAQATGGLQHPSIERENIYQDIHFPVRSPRD